jgi:RNase P/RNase MRP subunit p30
MLYWLYSFDFKGCMIENFSQEKIKEFENKIQPKEFFVYNRKTIDDAKKNPREMDEYRNFFDFITFFCTNPELTKWACQDQRIDSLIFPLNEINQLADDSTINLLKQNDKCIEISYFPILSSKNPIPILRNIKKVLYRASIKKLPILISSRASRVEHLRSGFSILGFANFMDLSDSYYKEISLTWLNKRLQRNVSRHTKEFVAPGIWIKNEEKS